jgi:hypothetical protein
MSDYAAFLSSKRHAVAVTPVPMAADGINAQLFPFQQDLVRWALERGRAALFADTGLGKTCMQLEWARHVAQHGRCLILTPLAVAEQTQAEAAHFHMQATYRRRDAGDAITITNYELLDRFDPADFAGIVLDESSILKAFDGKTRTQLIEAFAVTPWRLACTATPAPNDFTELGNHAEFLGIKARVEMLAEYFVHDGGSTQDWRLKGHGRQAFWDWVCSWAALVKLPSDLGYADDGFVLPPLVWRDVVMGADHREAQQAGLLFAAPAVTLSEQRAVRRASTPRRVTEAMRLAATADPVLIWCELNDEADAVTAAIPHAIQVKGSDSPEFKTAASAWFIGNRCICSDRLFGKATSCRSDGRDTGKTTTSDTGNSGSLNPGHINTATKRNGEDTCGGITPPIKRRSGPREPQNNVNESMPPVENATRRTRSSASNRRHPSGTGSALTPTSASRSASAASESPQVSTTLSLEPKAGAAPSAAELRPMNSAGDSTSTIATKAEGCAGFSAANATSESGSSQTTPNASPGRRCTCGHQSGHRVLVTKVSIFGFGLNWQHCARVVFLGASHSYEQTYQAVRRCWRFGQTRPVEVFVVRCETEAAIVQNYLRKEAEAATLAESMMLAARHYQTAARAAQREWRAYTPNHRMRVPGWLRSEAA